MFVFRPSVIASVNSRLHSLDIEGLRGKSVAFPKEAYHGDPMERATRGNRIECLTELICVRMLVRGRAELAGVAPRSFAFHVNTHQDEFAGRFKFVLRPKSSPAIEAFSALRPEAQQYADLVDKGLARITASGEYERISERWSFPSKQAPR